MNVPCKSRNYGDAKTSQLPQDDLLFEGKNRSEFERVKQKFDSRHSAKSYNMSGSAKNSSRKSDRHANQRIARSSEMSFDESKNNINIRENTQSFDCNPSSSKLGFLNQTQTHSSQDKPENNFDLAENFNLSSGYCLDGLKVSEDDDDDDVSTR